VSTSSPTTPGSPSGAGSEPEGAIVQTRRAANYVLGVLVLVYVFNFIDRQILNILLQSIKEDMGVSDSAMGFLTGPAFALFYTFAGIPIARWSDRGTRRSIVALGLVVWSALTAASGLARSFAQLAVARVGVGIGEATASPAAHSMISDLYPPERRATALSIYTIGAYVGMLLGLSAGGWIDEYFGWRSAFFVVGLPGLLVAVVVRFTVAEPPRGGVEGISAADTQPGTLEVFRYLWGLRSFRHIATAGALYAFSGYGFMTWAPTFFRRVYGLGPAEAGLWIGLVFGIGGGFGTLLGGLLADRGARRDVRWQQWVPAIGGAIMTPFLALFLFAENWVLGLAFYAPAYVAGQFYVGPTFAMTQGLARLRMRALASAVILFFMNLIGLGLGPQVVGILNDALAPRFGDDAIRYSLLVMALANLWAVAHSLLASRSLRADLRAAQGDASDPAPARAEASSGSSDPASIAWCARASSRLRRPGTEPRGSCATPISRRMTSTAA